MLAIGDPDKVQGIDLVTGKPTVRFPTLPEAFPKGQNVISLAFSPDSKQLAVGIGYLDGTIRLFDVNSGKSIGELPGHLTGVLGLRFSKDGKRLVSVSGDQSLRVWDVENWGVAKQREHLKFMGHGNEVFCLALKPDADYIAITGCKDGTLLGWDLRRKTGKEYFNILPRPVESVEFSADSRFMFTVNRDHSAGIWTTRPKISEVSTLSDAGKTVTNVTRVLPSPDGKYLAVGTTTGQVKVFDIANRRKICDLNDHEAPVAPVGFTHDGNTLITVDDDGVIIEWSTASWGKISMSQEKGVVWADHTVLSDAPNTGLLLLAPSDLKRTGWVSRWNLAQRKEQPPIDAHFSQEIGQMSISPDGQILAISASDTYVKLFNVATGEPWKPDKLRSNLLSIHGVTFSPDEPRLATGCTGNEAGVKLWDLTTGQDVLSLEAGTGMFFGGMRFSPDGNMIVAISTSGAHVWRAPSWEEITAAEAREKTTPVSSP
jgi:WD40 repeat protein